MATDARLEQLWRDQWAGMPAWRGTLPRVPQRAELPTASKELAGCIVRVAGASGVADKVYVCQKGADDGYSWVQVDGGGLGYVGDDKLSSSITGISSITSVLDDGVDVTAVGTRRYKLTCTIYIAVTSGGSFSLPIVFFRKDGTSVMTYQVSLPDTNIRVFTFWATDTVDDDSVTYDVAVSHATGNDVDVSACYLLVEDIGAAA